MIHSGKILDRSLTLAQLKDLAGKPIRWRRLTKETTDNYFGHFIEETENVFDLKLAGSDDCKKTFTPSHLAEFRMDGSCFSYSKDIGERLLELLLFSHFIRSGSVLARMKEFEKKQPDEGLYRFFRPFYLTNKVTEDEADKVNFNLYWVNQTDKSGDASLIAEYDSEGKMTSGKKPNIAAAMIDFLHCR